MNSLVFIGGNFTLGGNFSENSWNHTVLTSLTGLENLTSIGGSFLLGSNDNLTNFSGVENLISIGGSMQIGVYFPNVAYAYNPSLTSMTGLNSLTSIGGDLFILTTDVLTNLTGLENVTSIGGGLMFIANDVLTSLTGLEGVSSLDGGICIGNTDWLSGGNPLLTSLTGLENITSIGGMLKICNNDVLTSLTGLENVTFIGGDLRISSNELLSDCAVQSICNYLANPNGIIEIHDNATGCNSQQEVEDSCALIWVEDLIPLSSLIIYPNPTSTTITIETPSQASFPSITPVVKQSCNRKSPNQPPPLMSAGGKAGCIW